MEALARISRWLITTTTAALEEGRGSEEVGGQRAPRRGAGGGTALKPGLVARRLDVGRARSWAVGGPAGRGSEVFEVTLAQGKVPALVRMLRAQLAEAQASDRLTLGGGPRGRADSPVALLAFTGRRHGPSVRQATQRELFTPQPQGGGAKDAAVGSACSQSHSLCPRC